MKKQINFAVVFNDEQQMIINFHPPLVIRQPEGSENVYWSQEEQLKRVLGNVLITLNGSPAKVAVFDKQAIDLLKQLNPLDPLEAQDVNKHRRKS